MRLILMSAVGSLALAGCQPPAADTYVERVELAERTGAGWVLLEDPDTENALWAAVDGQERLLFGNPGEVPMLALACENPRSPDARIVLTRYAEADPQASALIALIGNSHIARLPVETQWNGRAWLWTGSWDAASPELAVFTGDRPVEATIPGAGSLELTGSLLPGQLVSDCLPQPERTEELEEPDELAPPEPA